jgi:hypothetical protein
MPYKFHKKLSEVALKCKNFVVYMVVLQKYIAAGYIRFQKLKAALLFGIQAFFFH